MNKIISLLLICLSFVFVSCAGTITVGVTQPNDPLVAGTYIFASTNNNFSSTAYVTQPYQIKQDIGTNTVVLIGGLPQGIWYLTAVSYSSSGGFSDHGNITNVYIPSGTVNLQVIISK